MHAGNDFFSTVLQTTSDKECTKKYVETDLKL